MSTEYSSKIITSKIKPQDTPQSDTSVKGIKSWAEEDRPREKLLLKGKKSLTNAELLAIILGSGSQDESAVELAKRIFAAYNNDLIAVAKLDTKALCEFKGIGPAKAVSVIAMLEMGRRMKGLSPEIKPKMTSSTDIYNLLRASMEDLTHEAFKVIYLNQRNSVLSVKTLSEGGIAGTVVDPRLIYKEALNQTAVAIILAHNHPSGNLKPSKQDIAITEKMKSAGLMLDIKVLDHLIISEHGYYSFADEGML